MTITQRDVARVAERLRGQVVETPLLSNAEFDQLMKRPIFVKAENMQRGGSFKFRGALHALSVLSAEQRRRGVIGASSGNHGLALALAGRQQRVPVTVVLPKDAPEAKRRAIEHHGARILAYDRREGTRDIIVAEEARLRKLAVIPSAEHPSVIAGAGTVALEMLRRQRDLRTIVVPVGGGGLAAGTALAVPPHVQVIGVEPATADDTRRSVRCGHRVQIDAPVTIADGLGHTRPPELTFKINQLRLNDVIVASEQSIADSMAYLWRHYGLKAEPSGAVALAGLLTHTSRMPLDGAIGVVVSGGNVDWAVYETLLRPALVRTDPYPKPVSAVR
ncbi:threonine/serine dehydratase [Streptomyces sp. NPDC015350]|uniref:threonine ammonia-lyase n=1 Tax=Streptomyces sp. NPDC015350 TaxID=3364955 RepID=UPI0036F934BD